MFLALSVAKCAESTAIAKKREENPEILTNLVRKRLSRILEAKQKEEPQKILNLLSGPVRDTPPPFLSLAIPFRDSIAEGGIAPICLIFIGYRASIAEIPLLSGGGVSHLHFACSPRGKRSEKGEGVSHPIGHVGTPKAP